MTDVLKIALDRRNKLHEDIRKLDDFIRMAETLVRGEGSGSGSAPAATTSDPAPATQAPVTQAHAASGSTTVITDDASSDESPMRMAARRLSDAEVRRAPEQEMSANGDAPRPSIIRRGLAAG